MNKYFEQAKFLFFTTYPVLKDEKILLQVLKLLEKSLSKTDPKKNKLSSFLSLLKTNQHILFRDNYLILYEDEKNYKKISLEEIKKLIEYIEVTLE